jgi:hypothetical protein
MCAHGLCNLCSCVLPHAADNGTFSRVDHEHEIPKHALSNLSQIKPLSSVDFSSWAMLPPGAFTRDSGMHGDLSPYFGPEVLTYISGLWRRRDSWLKQGSAVIRLQSTIFSLDVVKRLRSLHT